MRKKWFSLKLTKRQHEALKFALEYEVKKTKQPTYKDCLMEVTRKIKRGGIMNKEYKVELTKKQIEFLLATLLRNIDHELYAKPNPHHATLDTIHSIRARLRYRHRSWACRIKRMDFVS